MKIDKKTKDKAKKVGIAALFIAVPVAAIAGILTLNNSIYNLIKNTVQYSMIKNVTNPSNIRIVFSEFVANFTASLPLAGTIIGLVAGAYIWAKGGWNNAKEEVNVALNQKLALHSHSTSTTVHSNDYNNNTSSSIPRQV